MISKNYNIVLGNKQRGATLFTSLVFLMLITIVSVSAAKIASLDVLMAGNNQQQMLAFQKTDKTLKGFNNPVVVLTQIEANDGVRNEFTNQLVHNAHDPSSSSTATREIANRNLEYPCKAEGLATTVGNDNAPRCFLFDLSAEDKLENINIKDKHFRGSGKLLPDTSNYTE